MGRYHRIVTEVEGKCLQCGRCCGGCVDLVSKNGKFACAGHDDKPEACKRFPLDYAVELVPPECGFRVVKTRKVDETREGDRIRVSGRTGLALVKGIAAEEGEAFPDVYDLQTRLAEANGQAARNGHPRELAKSLRRIARSLVQLESGHTRRPLPDAEWHEAEKLCKAAIEAVLTYAERRDIVCGDLFPSEE